MIKAESNFADSLNDYEKKPKSKCRKSEVKADSSNMGLWDFLYQLIQDEKKEQEENPQSFKDMAKVCLQVLLWTLAAIVIVYICYGVITLVGSWTTHWLEELKP